MPGLTQVVGALRQGYLKAGIGLGDAAVRGFATGGRLGNLTGLGAGYAAKAMYKTALMSNPAMLATTGAAAGGLYGAFSSDTSMIGGALTGAGLFAGGYGLSRLGAAGYSSYGKAMARGLTRRDALSVALNRMGNKSMRFIGTTRTRAINAFQGMKSGTANLYRSFMGARG
jgi:hypothetical protein